MTPSPAAPETPTPPTPSLAEAARDLLDNLGLRLECRARIVPSIGTEWHTIGRSEYPATTCPACALRAALAAEEARDKLRREAADLLRRDHWARAHMEPATLSALLAALEPSR